MESIVLMHKDFAMTTSLVVAEKFHKRHDNVIQKIESYLTDLEIKASEMYQIGYYNDASGKRNKMYYMNRDGFSFLAMGFTGKEANKWKLKYIEAFNKMESHIKQSISSRVTQKDSMAVLKDANATHIDYIKANTIANKAVSNMYGHPKSIKKADMTEQELATRDKVLAETTKLMALKEEYGLEFSVKDKIYSKYKEVRYESS